MDAENRKENYLQKNSAKHEGYERAHRSFRIRLKERNSVQPELLEKIPDKDNLIITFKRKKAPGIADIAIAYFMENQNEFGNRIYQGKYIPSLVRKVEIPKLDGGVRKLGMPTVIDQTLQQAITQQLPIYEPLFAEGSYSYRPGRNAKRVKEYEEQGYTFAVSLDLSKYFDTLNHERLLNLLKQKVKDERVIQLIKRYLKSEVMENGVAIETPQGGNLSQLLENIYLDEFDKEYLRIGVPYVRYADDIVLLTKSKGASERLLESSTRYLEEKLKILSSRRRVQIIKLSLEKMKVWAG